MKLILKFDTGVEILLDVLGDILTFIIEIIFNNNKNPLGCLLWILLILFIGGLFFYFKK